MEEEEEEEEAEEEVEMEEKEEARDFLTSNHSTSGTAATSQTPV